MALDLSQHEPAERQPPSSKFIRPELKSKKCFKVYYSTQTDLESMQERERKRKCTSIRY